MTNAAQPLAAARGVESLLIGARDLLLDAEVLAEDGRLLMISRWIRVRIDSLDDELLKEVRAAVEALERRQVKEIDEALETAHRTAASGDAPVITGSLRDHSFQ